MFSKTLTSLIIASLVTPLVAIAAQASDLPGFRRVTKTIALGGPPTDEGISVLYNDHFLTVVDLREASDRTAQEHARVERMGTQFISTPFHYVNIPVGSGVPTQANLTKFLATLDVSPDQKVDWIPSFYVHGGKDQSVSAAMVAIWRIYHDDWDYDKAFSEMQNDGFNLKSPQANELIDFVKRYAETKK